MCLVMDASNKQFLHFKQEALYLCYIYAGHLKTLKSKNLFILCDLQTSLQFSS